MPRDAPGVPLSYVIEFYRRGLRHEISPHSGPLEDAEVAALLGLIEMRSDSARILDLEADFSEVWSYCVPAVSRP